MACRLQEGGDTGDLDSGQQVLARDGLRKQPGLAGDQPDPEIDRSLAQLRQPGHARTQRAPDVGSVGTASVRLEPRLC